ncbi:MAG: hypothetical protein H7318_03920 [Oligoflexus sp.]|nr:hypothetical protein [Oligoflexus sp.]
MNNILRNLFLSLFLASSSLVSTNAFADWTLNLGYHNPVNSKLGVNFLYWGSQWNFEVGIGYVDSEVHADEDKANENKDDDHVAASVAGDIDIKYRLMTDTFAPYVQGGFGAWTGAKVGERSGADADLGGPFVGVGFFIGKPAFHVYFGGNYMIDPETTQLQGGIGFDI